MTNTEQSSPLGEKERSFTKSCDSTIDGLIEIFDNLSSEISTKKKIYPKRISGLMDKICEECNIAKAGLTASKGRKNHTAVKNYLDNKVLEDICIKLQLEYAIFVTGEYEVKIIHEPKERVIFVLKFNPDRIVHHAIMNILEPIWIKIFTKDTYACIKGRGIHKLADDLKKILRKDIEGTKYCLKVDIKKFYPSINHTILKNIIRKKIKDKELLALLDEIIDSINSIIKKIKKKYTYFREGYGVPIGNYLSQFFANLTLAYFDHWVKEELKAAFKKRNSTLYYVRYADDMAFLSNNKQYLHKARKYIQKYLKVKLDLELKSNWQIFPVESRGIDMVGYVFYHTHTLLRKSMKKKIWKLIGNWEKGKISREQLKKSMCSYFGWLKHCDSKHLLQKIEEKTGLHFSNWKGKQINISNLNGKEIYLVNLEWKSKGFELQYMYKGKPCYSRSKNQDLLNYIFNYTDKFPVHIYV